MGSSRRRSAVAAESKRKTGSTTNLPPPSQRRALRQRESERNEENKHRYPFRNRKSSVTTESSEDDKESDAMSEDEEEVEEDESEEMSESQDEEVSEDESAEESVEESEEEEDDEDEADDEDSRVSAGDDEEEEEQEEENDDEDVDEEDDDDEDEEDSENDSRPLKRSRRGSTNSEESIAKTRPKRGNQSKEESNAENGSKRAKAGTKPQTRRSARGGLEVGADVLCRWSGNSEEYPARILKRRSSIEGEQSTADAEGHDAVEFYVRYVGFDHRLDEWVTKDRVRPAPDGALQSMVMPSPSPSPSACSGDESEAHHVKNIHSIELGKYEVETWYYSPYPEEYSKDGKLYICEFCLKYMKKRHTLERHAEKCEWRAPPGIEIYREGELSVYEVDGKKQRIYCQNLCLLSKLFLDHKTLYYDVDPFYFYILTECDADGAHIVGYFSKEKYSPDGYNLACIMTLPPYQRKGYGSFLISLSYELSKREGVVGSPEKPLSDLGRLGYRSYWSRVILSILRDHRGADLSVQDISRMTAIAIEDVVDTLKELKLVRYWKGKHVLVVSPKLVDAYLDSSTGKRFRVINASKLTYTARRSGRVTSGESRHGR